MARYTGPKIKQCRREGMNLFFLGQTSASGKVACLQRRDYPPGVHAQSRRRITDYGVRLRSLVEQQGAVRTDELTPARRAPRVKRKNPAQELEQRLLVHTRQVHTDSGAHARLLSTWDHWAAEEGVSQTTAPAVARTRFEAVLSEWRAELGGKATLPWT